MDITGSEGESKKQLRPRTAWCCFIHPEEPYLAVTVREEEEFNEKHGR